MSCVLKVSPNSHSFFFFSWRFDIYRKVPKDLTQPTVTGAVISIICVGFMLLLFFLEFFHYLSGELWVPIKKCGYMGKYYTMKISHNLLCCVIGKKILAVQMYTCFSWKWLFQCSRVTCWQPRWDNWEDSCVHKSGAASHQMWM